MPSRHLTSLALVVASTLLSVLAAEVLARVIGVEPMAFSVKEVATRTVDGVALWGDKYSRYDGEDIRRASSERDSFWVVGLGDSILYGVSVPKEQTYLEQMRRSLAGRVKRQVEVLNLAVPGYNTMQEFVAYKEIADGIKADLVLVHYWEDDDQQYRIFGRHVVDLGDVSEEEARLLMRPLPVPPPINDLLLVHSRLYGLLGRVLAASNRDPQPQDWTRVSAPLADIQARVESGGGRLVILASPALDPEMPRPNADLPRLRQFASAHGIEVVDLTEWLPGVTSQEIALDGCHFNATGHRLLGQHLAEYLRLHDLKDSPD